MERFIERYKDRIVGSITGFDRILFRGKLISICHEGGMARSLSSQKVLYKDFKSYAEKFTDRIKKHVQEMSQSSGRPYEYLASPSMSKEKYVRELLERNPVKEGLICILGCVELCHSYSVRGNYQTKQLELHWGDRKCQHYYFYYMDREFGLMHVRLQSWFPFTIQICVNGREWLANQLDKNGIEYKKVENCYTEISDIEKARACWMN